MCFFWGVFCAQWSCLLIILLICLINEYINDVLDEKCPFLIYMYKGTEWHIYVSLFGRNIFEKLFDIIAGLIQ